jgi:hypothetical protein
MPTVCIIRVCARSQIIPRAGAIAFYCGAEYVLRWLDTPGKPLEERPMPLHHNIAVLRYVDPCLGLPRRTRRPPPAERRPKFISVTVLIARFWECSHPSNWFNLYGNCYKFRRTSLVDRNSFRSPREARDSEDVQPRPLGSTLVWGCRVARGARFRQSVDRNLFRSPC